jgi:hypothetical protein
VTLSGDGQPDPARPTPAEAADVYRGLRQMVLDLEPGAVGLADDPNSSAVWGALMDMGVAGGSATLVALADGTTSLYLSSGGGMIGAGGHAAVADATRAFLASLQEHLTELRRTDDVTVPREGRIAFLALTHKGRMRAEADEDDLGYGRHPLALTFRAAHDVLTELRLIDESRSGLGSEDGRRS